MADMAKILKRIQALRARAEDSASSEAEAAMAARKMQEMLEEHNLTLSEADIRADGVVRHRWDRGTSTRPKAVFAMKGIQKATNTEGWISGGVVSILGAPADVETALYFLDLVDAACESCWRTFQRSAAYYDLREGGLSARKIGADFRIGVASRLGERIAQQYADQAATVESTTTGRALVPVKNALIKDWMRSNGIHLRSGRSRSVGSGYSHGRAAGGQVGIGRGVGHRQRTTGLLN